MKELRRVTQRIPATPLLVEVWNDTPKGSTIRALLLEWTSEFMRASTSREQVATELPHGVLTELVVKMANNPLFEIGREPAPPTPSFPTPTTVSSSKPLPTRIKNVHYLVDDSEDELASSRARRVIKRQSTGSMPASQLRQPNQHHHQQNYHNYPMSTPRGMGGRRSDIGIPSASSAKAAVLRAVAQKGRRKSTNVIADPSTFTTDQKLNFCHDLVTRMLSGPGELLRAVGMMPTTWIRLTG
jgi:hypothetical protein